MADTLIREVRRATLSHWKADTSVTSLMTNLHPSTTPTPVVWPFGRFDAPQSIPIDMTCVAGATVTFLYHAFARDRQEGGVTVETAEDYASRIGAALHRSIHNRRLPVAGTTARFRVRSSRVLADGDEQSAYHAILSIEARVLAA